MSARDLLVRTIKGYLDEGDTEMAAILLDLLNGDRRAPEPVSLEPSEGEATRLAMSQAERARAYRARRASRSVTATVTENVTRVTESVTASVTDRHENRHEASRLARSLSESGSGSSSQSSSHLSSLGEGSDLEEREGARVTATVTKLRDVTASVTLDGYPDRIVVTESVRARCVTAGAPEPTEADAAACLEDARSKGQRFPDWEARLVRWQIMAKNHAASARGRRGGVQPAPAGYADELIAAGERRAREGA